MKLYTSRGEYPGKKVGYTKSKRIYHYTSFDTFVKIWLSKKLKFGSVSNVNDILETTLTSGGTHHFDRIAVVYAYNQIRQEYKQISFTVDFDSFLKGSMSPMLWGHYGDKRRGVCIEFDLDKLHIPKKCFARKVIYKKFLNRDRIIDKEVTTIKQIHSYIKKNKKDIFFTKQNFWKGENEYRIVSREYDYLDIGDAITAVYLTSCNSPECLYVEQLVGDSVDVYYLHYKIGVKNLVIPYLSKTKENRLEQEQIAAEESSCKWINIAKEKFESCRKDENASLIVDESLLW